MALLDALVGDPEVEAVFADAADLAAMLRFETALAQAQAGSISPEAARAIVAACGDFQPDWASLADGLARDGVVVPALLKQLRPRVAAPHGAALHSGATSQDVIDTSLVLRLKTLSDILDGRLVALLGVLAVLATRDGARTLQAHTRMQVALPFAARDKITTWASPLERHRTRLAELRPRLLVLQLGGPVGTRAELGPEAGVIAADVARRLELGEAPPWHSARDGIVELGNWLSLVAGSLGKIGQDVALLAQNEVGAVALAGGGASSAMAHKQNPVAAEVLVALARHAAGLSGMLQGAMVHENERSGAAWTLEWLTLPPLAITTAAALRTAATLLDGLRFT